ncbi:MAG: glycosyltransferase family 2 protein [Bacteroidota bacterium]
MNSAIIYKDPLVFAVVLNYNGFDDTKNCIKSLINSGYSNLKIVIVDNSSTDNSLTHLKNNFNDFSILTSDVNKGYAAGMNIGIKHSLENEADFILIINNDTIVEEKFLQPMIDLFNTNESIGIVSPKVGYLENRDVIYCAGGRINRKTCVGTAEFQGKEFDQFANSVRETDFAEGCCLLVRTEVFKRLGYFEEKFFMYYEDLEFSERVNSEFKIYYNPHSVIYHRSGAGKKWSEYSSLYYFYFTRNRLWYYSNKGFGDKIYVAAFSLIIVCAKSLVLIIAFLFAERERAARIKESLIAQICGFFGGIKLLFK